MIGLAAENIVAGTLSDSFGRKKPLIIAMILFTIASVLCALASDLYRGNALIKFMATLMLVNGVTPVLAPVISGVILTFTTWRVMFFILMIFGVLMFIGSATQIKESLLKEARSKVSFKAIFADYRRLFRRITIYYSKFIQIHASTI